MNNIERFIPNLSGLVDPKAEIKFAQAFTRIYEYFELRLTQVQQEMLKKMKEMDLSKDDINNQHSVCILTRI